MTLALIETMEYIVKNRPKVVEYLTTKWYMDRDVAEQLGEFIPLLTMDGKMTTGAVQEYLDQAYQSNQIPNRVRASQVLELSLLDPAAGKK